MLPVQRALAWPLRRIRYGRSVIVVSGLPRSGTSMLMNMLAAGGVEILEDGTRRPDDDNPKGYFELQSVTRLKEDADKLWLHKARGRAVKVVSHLLADLPDEHHYQVIFSERRIDEVITSQNRMLVNRGERNPVDDDTTRTLYLKHLRNVEVLVATRRNFEMLKVDYRETLSSPEVTARTIRGFLNRDLNLESMSSVVDPALYRNRLPDSR